MDEAIRLQYLEAMGIDVWVSRRPPAAAQANSEPSENAEQAFQSQAQPAPASAFSETGGDRLAGSHSQDFHSPLSPTEETAPAVMPMPHSSEHRHADEHPWKELQQQVSLCRACSLCESRTQTVFGVGNRHASWMLIGEAPGQNEDLQGEPFVGRAGQLLNEMLRAIGLQREHVYIANILKCRPPNNRDPQADEVAACHDFLHRQISLIRPKIILAVGRIAAQNLLNTQQPLAKLRRIRHQLDGVPLVVIPHPAYLLRSLPEKAKAWEDLKFALSTFQELDT